MKISIALAVSSLLGLAVLSHSADPAATPSPGVEISRDDAQKIPTYDLSKVEDKAHLLAGKIVKVKFNYRSSSVRKAPDGKLHGSIGSSTTMARNLHVIIPAEAEAWFMKIPTTYEASNSRFVIARLASAASSEAELLGREIKTDLVTGSKIVW